MAAAVIWDCDGVLVDSERYSCAAWLPVLARRGVEVRLSDIEAWIGRSDRDLLEHFRRLTGQPLDGDLVEEHEQEYSRRARGALCTFPGLPEVLAHLRGEGWPLAVASSSRPERIRFSLAETGLDRFLDLLCSATEVARGKPAPDLFLLAARRLGVAPRECVVIEDSVPGIQAAARARMRPLGFTSSHPAEVLAAAGAEATFDRYSLLPDLLDWNTTP